MSSNRFNLDRAVDALRSELPSGEARVRAKNFLLKPKPVSYRPRLVVLGLVGAAAVALLWPRGESGSAWAQIASQTRGQVRMHMATYVPGKSVPYMERWVDGNRYKITFELHPPKQKPIYDFSICDGRRVLYYRGNELMKNGEYRSAHVAKVQPGPRDLQYSYGLMGAGSNLIDDVIKQEGWKVQSQKEKVSSAYGVRDVYVLSIRYPHATFTRFATVYVDSETKLIREAEFKDEGGLQTALAKIDYPDSFPSSTFALVAPPGVRIRDFDKDREHLETIIRKGLGTKTVAGKTITLRAVVHAGWGEMWVLWTGGAPAGDLRNPIQVAGFPKAKPFGIKTFTIKPDPRSKPAPAIGQRLGGMAILIQRKLDKITVTIPVLDATGKKKLGTATFADVPVFRVESIYDVAETLGIR